MMERFWDAEPKAIQMYSIKQHMQKEPTLKNTNIMDLTKNDYDNLKTSDWAKYINDKRPGSEMAHHKPAENKKKEIQSMK